MNVEDLQVQAQAGHDAAMGRIVFAITVKGQNGDPVTDLVQSSFKIYDVGSIGPAGSTEFAQIAAVPGLYRVATGAQAAPGTRCYHVAVEVPARKGVKARGECLVSAVKAV